MKLELLPVVANATDCSQSLSASFNTNFITMTLSCSLPVAVLSFCPSRSGIVEWKEPRSFFSFFFSARRHLDGVARDEHEEVNSFESNNYWFVEVSVWTQLSVWASGAGWGIKIPFWMPVMLAVGQTGQVKQCGLLSMPAGEPTQQGTHGRPHSTLLAAAPTFWQLDLQRTVALHTLGIFWPVYSCSQLTWVFQVNIAFGVTLTGSTLTVFTGNPIICCTQMTLFPPIVLE